MTEQLAWEMNCMEQRGRMLTGEKRHYCEENWLSPTDETCPEWPCACADNPPDWWNQPKVVP